MKKGNQQTNTINKVNELQNKARKLKQEQVISYINKDKNSNEYYKNLVKTKIKARNKLKNKRTNLKRKLKKKRSHKISIAETKIAYYLQNKRISFQREHTFPGLINPETNQQLRLDFYLPEINTAIEYDGKQHFIYVPEIHGKDILIGQKKLLSQKKRDNIKTDYCNYHNIRLIRLNYKDFYHIEQSLNKLINPILQQFYPYYNHIIF